MINKNIKKKLFLKENKNKPKYIFVTGGVVSSLGKGISSATIAALLKLRGYKVFIQKFDPYLNVDPGTMNPTQHGEVFVTYDGVETDLDLGHYERFIDQELTQNSNVTAGKIFKEILDRERQGYYLGNTIQYIPHVIDLIKEKIILAATKEKYDFVITEIGGTVGDIELQTFLEAIRQFISEKKFQTCFIHAFLLPYLNCTSEYKSKPAQRSIKELHSVGISPNILLARSVSYVSTNLLKKISVVSGINLDHVFNIIDFKIKYYAPIYFYEKKIDETICEFFGISLKKSSIKKWKEIDKNISNSKIKIKIALVGKYVSLKDAYISVNEALLAAGYFINRKVEISWIDSEKLTKLNYQKKLKSFLGIIVPGGFDKRGCEGKILAIQYARTKNIPFLGLCLGFQLAIIEYLRNVVKLKDVNSTELNKNTKNPAIYLIKGKRDDCDYGGTLRLGNYLCTIKNKKSLAFSLYKATKINERHRHRYEFNNDYEKFFPKNETEFSGVYLKENLYEIYEMKNHPFFIASQFHPEFKSRPSKPHPLFLGFIKSASKINNSYGTKK